MSGVEERVKEFLDNFWRVKEKEIKIYTWWVSCKKFTCLVVTQNHKIVGGAPIIRRWIGREFENLLVECGIDRISLLQGGCHD